MFIDCVPAPAAVYAAAVTVMETSSSNALPSKVMEVSSVASTSVVPSYYLSCVAPVIDSCFGKISKSTVFIP